MNIDLTAAYLTAIIVSAGLAVAAAFGAISWWLVPAPIEAVTGFAIYLAVLILERAAREGGRVAVRFRGKVRFYINFDR